MNANVNCLRVGTIRTIHKALNANGYQISENAIREWVRSGKLPSVHSGNTAYISYDAVVALLTGTPTMTA